MSSSLFPLSLWQCLEEGFGKSIVMCTRTDADGSLFEEEEEEEAEGCEAQESDRDSAIESVPGSESSEGGRSTEGLVLFFPEDKSVPSIRTHTQLRCSARQTTIDIYKCCV